MRLIFRLSGEYVGYLESGWFFHRAGGYLGWYDDQDVVWYRDGTALGQLVDKNYILRRLNVSSPVRRTPPVPPVSGEPPTPPSNRAAKVPLAGWVDGLVEIGRRPAEADLHGDWEVNEGTLRLNPDGSFRWLTGSSPEETGEWLYRGNLVLSADPVGEARPPRVVYAVLDYARHSLTVRAIRIGENSLPLTLRRKPGSGDASG